MRGVNGNFIPRPPTAHRVDDCGTEERRYHAQRESVEEKLGEEVGEGAVAASGGFLY